MTPRPFELAPPPELAVAKPAVAEPVLVRRPAVVRSVTGSPRTTARSRRGSASVRSERGYPLSHGEPQHRDPGGRDPGGPDPDPDPDPDDVPGDDVSVKSSRGQPFHSQLPATQPNACNEYSRGKPFFWLY